jgi:hypothetical protein
LEVVDIEKPEVTPKRWRAVVVAPSARLPRVQDQLVVRLDASQRVGIHLPRLAVVVERKDVAGFDGAYNLLFHLIVPFTM